MKNEDHAITILLQEFEAAWQDGHLETTQKMLAAPDLSIDAAAELVMVDLEYRWRASCQSSEKNTGSNPLQLEDYIAICPALSSEAIPRDLIAEEFRVRHRWGDEPTLQTYQNRFGQSPELDDLLTRVLNELDRVQICVIKNGTEVFQASFRQQLTLGRQAVDEPEPCCILKNGNVSKLIFTDLSAVQISRNQLLVSLLPKNEVRLKNLSSAVVCVLNPGGVLSGNNALTSKLPICIHISEFEIRLARA